MNKEEILRRSRSTTDDEGMTHSQNEGRRLASWSTFFVILFLVIFNAVNDIENTALVAILWADIAGSVYPVYRFSRKKRFLFLFVFAVCATLAFLVLHIVRTLR